MVKKKSIADRKFLSKEEKEKIRTCFATLAWEYEINLNWGEILLNEAKLTPENKKSQKILKTAKVLNLI